MCKQQSETQRAGQKIYMLLSSHFSNLFKLIAVSRAKLLPEADSYPYLVFLAREIELWIAPRGQEKWGNSSSAG